jgi:hypothetical protein
LGLLSLSSDPFLLLFFMLFSISKRPHFLQKKTIIFLLSLSNLVFSLSSLDRLLFFFVSLFIDKGEGFETLHCGMIMTIGPFWLISTLHHGFTLCSR